MHRSTQWWGDDADQFVMERWLAGTTGGNSAGKGKGGSVGKAYLPFSVGMRSCVGQVFAMQEARIVVCEMVRAFDMWRDGRERLWEEIRVSYSPHEVKVELSNRDAPDTSSMQ